MQDIEFIKTKRGHSGKLLGTVVGSTGIVYGVGLSAWIGPGALVLSGIGGGIVLWSWTKSKKYKMYKDAILFKGYKGSTLIKMHKDKPAFKKSTYRVNFKKMKKF